MSAAGQALWKALDKPEDWNVEQHRIVHKPSKQGFWIANGAFFFDGDSLFNTPKCLGLLERHWLYWKVRRIQVRLVAARLAHGAKC